MENIFYGWMVLLVIGFIFVKIIGPALFGLGLFVMELIESPKFRWEVLTMVIVFSIGITLCYNVGAWITQ